MSPNLPKSEGTHLSDSTTLARGAAVNLFGTVARFSRTIFTVFVTRIFGAQVFGIFTLATGIVDLVSRFTIFGMDKSLLKYIPETDISSDKQRYAILSSTFLISQVLSLFFTLLLFFAAPWISEVWLRKPELSLPLRLISFSILPVTLLNLFLSATKARKIMVYDAVVTGILYPLLLLLFSIPVIWVQNPEAGLSLAFTAASLAAMLSALWCYRKHFSLSKSLTLPPRKALSNIISFSTPLGLHDFVQYMVMKLEIFILAFFVTSTEIGIYALAVELAFVLKKFRQIFDPILIPLISEFQSQGDKIRVQANIVRVIRWILTLGILYLGVMSLFGSSLLNLFGKSFSEGAVLLIIVCLAQLVNASTGLLDLAMMVSGRPKINLLNALILLVLQTGFYLWLVPRLGLLGAAIGTLVSLSLLGLTRLMQSFFILRLNPLHRTQIKPIFAGILSGAFILLVRNIYEPFSQWPLLWIANLALFVATYSFALKLLGLEDEERNLLRRIKSHLL